jgi:hypothetical protein
MTPHSRHARAQLAVNSRTRQDSTGRNEGHPTAVFALARDRSCWVAGQGFENSEGIHRQITARRLLIWCRQKTFLLVNIAAPPRCRRQRCAGWTSWPISRILWLRRAHDQPHGAPGHHVKRSANREAIAKWLQVRLPTTETKQHVSGYTQSVTDEPFLNRVLFFQKI